MIIVKNLSYTVGTQKILDNLSFSIKKGTITTFIGKSGAGKTSLLKIIAGLYNASKDTIFIENKDLTNIQENQRCQKIGFVFQNFNLFPHMTVLENCIDPLVIKNIPALKAKTIAKEKLNLLGMLDYLHKYPSQLSGGQQQRIAIARALCLNPEIILLDEPTASLDPINTENLVAILKDLQKRGITIITSSQDMSFVAKIFDQVYFMQNGMIVEYSNDIKNIKNSPNIKSFLEY